MGDQWIFRCFYLGVSSFGILLDYLLIFLLDLFVPSMSNIHWAGFGYPFAILNHERQRLSWSSGGRGSSRPGGSARRVILVVFQRGHSRQVTVQVAPAWRKETGRSVAIPPSNLEDVVHPQHRLWGRGPAHGRPLVEQSRIRPSLVASAYGTSHHWENCAADAHRGSHCRVRVLVSMTLLVVGSSCPFFFLSSRSYVSVPVVLYFAGGWVFEPWKLSTNPLFALLQEGPSCCYQYDH